MDKNTPIDQLYRKSLTFGGPNFSNLFSQKRQSNTRGLSVKNGVDIKISFHILMEQIQIEVV